MRMVRNNLLFSYHFLRQNNGKYNEFVKDLYPYANIMIDSGAFSDFTATQKALKYGYTHDAIKVEDYIAACHRDYHGKVWQYVMLDVISNSPKSQANLDKMYQSGLRPMPVLTNTDPYERMLELCEKYQRRICVAGGVKSSDSYIYKRYQKSYKASNGKALIHALGFLRWPDVFQLPIATGDSSTSSSGARFGHLTYYLNDRGFIRSHWKDIIERPNEKDNASILAFLKRCNVTVEDMKNPESYRTSYGLPSLVEMFATQRFMLHSSQRSFGVFTALATPLWLMTYAAVLSCTNETFTAFDFQETKNTLRILHQAYLNDLPKATRMTADILDKHTDHHINPLTEEQTLPVDYSKKMKGNIKS